MTANPPIVVEPDDAELLRRYRAGDAASFTPLYERHRLGLFRFLLGLCGDHAVAEEVFQDTWMSLIRSESLQREAAVLFKTWLYQIARNRLIDHWRRHGKRQQREDAFDEQLHDRASGDPDPERQLSLSQDQARIQAALDDLPAEQREVFLLRAHADLALHEIAELTHTPAETVKSRLRYAMQKLRRLLSVAEEVSP
ncbi:RNA polymerase sigma-70 factor, ECF subfamily [Pseudomonas flavescens]|uniref:RNA polymerase sigma-70 factor, ECF subfamily n=1 Tax=Phytopseudomonas flavescens TaxID=29435 RepID=A0A1G8BSB8_9GAMM|nr:RNA polymerase sigma factor [Pseudomonas flavescens]SDH36072.1 RNA polymerase sigma-70 factor, ECF subfamily [Pseudomonas flavescens]